MKGSKYEEIFKISTALLTTAAVVSPLALAISCGSSADLVIGIRTDEIDLWQPVVEKFEKATGKTVELIGVSNFQSDYTNWAGSGTIPDVTIIDGGVRGEAEKKENQWFQDLDLVDIFKNDKYEVEGLTSDKDMDPNDRNQFNNSIMNWAKTDGEVNKWDAYPASIGPAAMYYIKDQLKEVGKIDSYVVTDDADPTKRVVKYEPSNAKDNNLAWTTRDEALTVIQNYLTNSINVSFLPTAEDISNNWYSIGAASLTQRIFSIAKSAFKTPSKAAMLQNADVQFGQFIDGVIGAEKDYSPRVTNDKTTLDDHAAFTTKHDSQEKWVLGNPDNDANVTDLTKSQLQANSYMMKPYYSNLGYFNGKEQKNMMSSDAADVKDSQTAFAKGEFNLMRGALWMLGGIKSKLKSNNISEDKLGAIALPFGSTSADSYGIPKSTTGERDVLAKQFLRYIATDEANAAISANKTVSNNKKGQSIQIEANKNDEVFKAFLSFGNVVNNPPEGMNLINDIQGIYNGSSTDNINYQWFQSTFADHKNPDEKVGKAVTVDNYLNVLNSGMKKYWGDIKISKPNDWKTSHPIWSAENK